MTAIELLDLLSKHAMEYRNGANDSIKRNDHMHNHEGNIPQDTIDAVLVDFINDLARERYCIDFAIYAKDLNKSAERKV